MALYLGVALVQGTVGTKKRLRKDNTERGWKEELVVNPTKDEKKERRGQELPGELQLDLITVKAPVRGVI